MSPARPRVHPAAVTHPTPGRIRSRRAGRSAAGALLLVLLVAGPAAAHPFVRGEVPVDSLATMTLAMAHGCESETAGEGAATTDVSLQVPDWLRVVDVPAESPWTVEREMGEDGTLEVVTWHAEDPEQPAPAFALDVVISGTPGEDRFLRVFQACDDFVYRWIGTPDEPADDPAVRVMLAAADPDAPPPPEPEPAPPSEAGAETDPPDADAPDADAPDTDGDQTDPEDADGAQQDAATQDAARQDAGDAEAPTSGSDTDAAADAEEAGSEAADTDADEGWLPGWALPMALAIVLAVAAGLFFRRGL